MDRLLRAGHWAGCWDMKLPRLDLCPQEVRCSGGARQSLLLGRLYKLTGARLAYLARPWALLLQCLSSLCTHLVLPLQMPLGLIYTAQGIQVLSETWFVSVISIPQQVLSVCTLCPSLPHATPGLPGSLADVGV